MSALRRKPGFSMAEVGIAVLVLAIALVPLLGLLATSQQSTAASVHQAVAFNLAAGTSDLVCAMPYDQIPITEDLEPQLEAEPLLLPPKSNVSFTRKVKVEALSALETSDHVQRFSAKLVSVTVGWSEPGTAERRSQSVARLVTHYP